MRSVLSVAGMSGLAYGERVHDAIVIGGGIIGLSTALELRRRGRSVLVLERHTVAKRGSCPGVLAPQIEAKTDGPIFRLGTLSRRLYPDWIASLESRTGISCGYHVDGSFVLSADEEALEGHWQSTEWQRQRELRVERVRESVLREQIPGLEVEVCGALYFPDAAQVDPARLMEALVVACRLEGVEIVERAAAQDILRSEGRVAGVRVAGGQVPCGEVIIAAGAWSSLIPGGAPRDPPVFPVRAQLLAVDPGRPLFRSPLWAGTTKLVPRRNGHIIVGATMEQAGYDERVTVAGLHVLLERLRSVLPELSEAEVVGHWSGIRPATSDEHPVIGRTAVPGLSVATGHFQNGVLWAPATAQLVADIVEGKTTEIDLGAFSTPRRPML